MVQDDTFLLSVIHRGASEEEARAMPPCYSLTTPLRGGGARAMRGTGPLLPPCYSYRLTSPH